MMMEDDGEMESNHLLSPLLRKDTNAHEEQDKRTETDLTEMDMYVCVFLLLLQSYCPRKVQEK